MRQSFECCGKKIIGKPCEGEPHARFDEGRVKISLAYSTIIMKGGNLSEMFDEIPVGKAAQKLSS